MTDPGKAHLTNVIPLLPARDVAASVRFYVDRLGFDVAFHEADYAAVRRAGVVLHLPFQLERDFEAGTAGQCMLHVMVDDPDRLFDEYKNEGDFHDQTRLRDTEWGTREFAFWDLNHNGLTFLRDL